MTTKLRLLKPVAREPGGGGRLAGAEPPSRKAGGARNVFEPPPPPAGGIEIGNLPTQFHRFIHRRGNRGRGQWGKLAPTILRPWGRSTQLFMRPGTVGQLVLPKLGVVGHKGRKHVSEKSTYFTGSATHLAD